MLRRTILRSSPFIILALAVACGDSATDPPTASALHEESGTGQEATVGTALAQPLVVRVTDQRDRPMSGVAVSWQTSDGGTFEPTTSQTDAQGRASTVWTLGPAAGGQVATAQVSGVAPVSFSATGAPGTVARVRIEPGEVTLDDTGAQHAFSAVVADQFDNSIEGEHALVWASLDPEVASVDDEGVATAEGVGSARIVVSLEEAADTAVVVARETVTASGGSVSAAGGAVVLEIPAGAVGEGTPIGVEPVPADDLPSGSDHLAGTVYRFSPSGITFDEPVTLAIAYEAGAIPAGHAESRLVVRTLVDGEWSRLPQNVADADAREVRTTLGGFSVYGIGLGPAWTQVTTGSQHACGLDDDGAAWCWGSNESGQLGTGDTEGAAAPRPVTGGIRFATIEAAEFHTCGLDDAGAAWCWGRNGFGQLGDGTSTDRDEPVPVSGGHTFTALSVGGFHVCGLTSAGAAFCWGRNNNDALGAETTEECTLGTLVSECSRTPVAVSGELAFEQISTGLSHTCAVTSAGAGYCWGWNAFWQLGDQTNANRQTPTPVAGEQTFAAIAAGAVHSCGIASDGAAYCWGTNMHGGLGNGETSGNAASPVAVVGGHAFASIAATKENNLFNHVCGMTRGDALYCWGVDDRGQLGGDASQTCTQASMDFPCSGEPVHVGDGRSYTGFAAAARFTCAAEANGEAWCWGLNAYGQQGNGAITPFEESDPASRVLFPWEPAGAAAADLVPSRVPFMDARSVPLPLR